jgi:SAM-dependent methyltransferase
MQDAVTTPQWEEENSQDFIDYGKYFVPDREIQINCICEVIPPPSESAYILDLCCGEGLLTRALLDKFPESHVYGLDGSLKMIAHIEKTLVAYGERFKARQFDLAASDWRDFSAISTLTMHHFLPERKVTIYRKVREALRTAGIYVEGDQATTVEEEKSILYWYNRWIAKLPGGDRAEWNYDITLSPGTQARILREAGFSEVQLAWHNPSESAVYVAKY